MNQQLLREVAQHFATPFYLFDERVLVQTIEHLKAGLGPNVELCYAMKANPLILAAIESEVARIEVCSTGELRICQMAGIPLSKVVLSGVHKDPELIFELVSGEEQPLRYTVESAEQYQLLERAACEADVRIPLLFRLTSGNQFGLDIKELLRLVEKAVASPYVHCCGIHYFAGTQRTSAKKAQRELRKVDDLLGELALRYPGQLDGLELEYGPGLPVSYFEHDAEVARERDDAQLAAVSAAIGELRNAGTVAVELGRAIAAECGSYVTSVVDAKRNRGYNYAIVDGGMHQLAYYDHAMALQQPVCVNLSSPQTNSDELWNVCGSLCTINDILGKQMPLGQLRIGDLLAFDKTGAYCMTEGRSLFLSRDLPRILLVHRDGIISQIRDRIETCELNAGTLIR